MVTVIAPGSVPRGGRVPSFEVDAGPAEFVALELAADPLALTPQGRAAHDSPGLFYGSWSDGPLRRPGRLELPLGAWSSLQRSPRLWFQALSSRRPDQWVDVVASVSDDQIEEAPYVAVLDVALAPGSEVRQVHDVWNAAIEQPDILNASRAVGANAAVVRHSSTPRRPAPSGSITWLVFVAAPSSPGVQEVISQLTVDSLAPVDTTTSVAAKRPPEAINLASAVLDLELAAAVDARTALTRRVGPVFVWQDLAPPPPDGIGGTVVVGADTGRLHFAQKVSWQRGAEI